MTDEVFDTDGQETETVEPSVQELLQQMIAAQNEHRAEVKALRDEVQKAKAPVPQNLSIQKTAEQLTEERFADIRQHTHYCPGCGKLSKYMRECSGKAEAPHPPIDMVSTEELLGDDPTQHTPAPETTNLG